jgi:hypothetical protein
MATILEFRRTEAEASRTKRPVVGSLGEIIIFPGVRIERRASDDVPRHDGETSGGRPQRNRKKSRA